ncbi:MAG: hypothetical protein EKK41_03280 [Hyphomicrobiales bacterium]|nr:MAG: hypothetical protein EKK41_03280 [Hyphomicrobiales bacterium]
MRLRNIIAVVTCVGTALVSTAATATTPVDVHDNGTFFEAAGRKVSCGRNIRTILDPQLPNLGIATRNLLVMNPRLLQRQPENVRLFVFHHECGHHHVGGDELGADCWAVRQGVASGWLHAPDLKDICRSFGNTPETPTHPASARRCQALATCFARAEKSLRPAPQQSVALLRPPALVREGYLASAEDVRASQRLR